MTVSLRYSHFLCRRCGFATRPGCFAVRSFAMVPAPGAPVLVPSPIVEQYRLRMRQHLGIPNQLDASRCAACRNPQTTTEGGRLEHHRTGACEACWDVLAASTPQARAAAVNRCSRLDGADACGYFLTWIEINRVSFGGTLRVHPDLARHIFAIGTGVMNPPNLWRPNERP